MANEKNVAFEWMKADAISYILKTYASHGQVNCVDKSDDDRLFEVIEDGMRAFVVELLAPPRTTDVTVIAWWEDEERESAVGTTVPIPDSTDARLDILQSVIDYLIASKSASGRMSPESLFSDDMVALAHMNPTEIPDFSVRISQSTSGGSEVQVHLIRRNESDGTSLLKTIPCDSPERAREVAADCSEITARLVDADMWRDLVLRARRNRISELRRDLLYYDEDELDRLDSDDVRKKLMKLSDEEMELEDLDPDGTGCHWMMR